MREARAIASLNFDFLADHAPHLVRLAGQAERYLADDPNTCLIKLRQFSELLAHQVAAKAGLYVSTEDNFRDVLDRLRGHGLLGQEVDRLFHRLRRSGNAAAHEFRDSHNEALQSLKLALALAVWFHRAVSGDRHFAVPDFVLPPAAQDATHALGERVLQLQQELEAERRRFAEEMAAMQAKAIAEPPKALAALVANAQQAESEIELDEGATRQLIDDQLRDAGWEVDSSALTHAKGARPEAGHNRAIAEWPTPSGRADYALFAGLRLIGVVEAKRRNTDVAAAIEQAKRYARELDPGETALGPWGEYKVPFLFSTNGRPYLRQLLQKSGIWFLDARLSSNHPRALEGWHPPDGLLAMLAQDVAAADQALRAEPFAYLDLRDYQKDAIRAVESALADGRRELLVAMATGTGKTRTCIGLVYRMIKAKRFRRVLFLVDRSALGEQTENAFKDMRLESMQTFTDIYDVKGLGDVAPDADTRLHIATVQGMVKRLFYTGDAAAPPIDQYDCVVIDECHRGYNLDKDLSEAELGFRSEDEYISTYRRVLDHFDAVKIGLTATPALHTTEIFGEPVYQYSYRQAVIDGYLVDYEPPIRIVTALAEDGMRWKAGETMEVYNTRRQNLDLVHLPDEVKLEVDAFNRQVVTENFNRVVCAQLAQEIDPGLDGKTLIFCATDSHADLVVRLLKEAYDARYGGIDDDAIVKITGASDKPLALIRRFKNERLPQIAVTVDLLSTGIDVPAIVNLVFLRRVRSRILYEQMMGRATRLCPDIEKETFRVFDAVELFEALEPVTAMKPVVTNPNITFEQLAQELTSVSEDDHRQAVYEQFMAKLRRKAAKLASDERFEAIAGLAPGPLLNHLQTAGPNGAAAWLKDHADLALYLDRKRTGDDPRLIISHHADELRRVERGYGTATRPEDYLDAFSAFIRDNLNLIPALTIVTTRPRDLTRQQLKELKLALDKAGYNEAALQTAWRETTNEDIAASIIGFIRQRALGSPLVPYAERVEAALKRILAQQPWSQPQRKWLQNIASQLKREVIVDRQVMDQEPFKGHGGFARIDKAFDGRLGELLGDLQEQIWQDAG